jgi:hypothetical protein
LSGGLVYIVYNVQSAGRPLGRLKRHNVTILSAYLTHIWTEWCGFPLHLREPLRQFSYQTDDYTIVLDDSFIVSFSVKNVKAAYLAQIIILGNLELE